MKKKILVIVAASLMVLAFVCTNITDKSTTTVSETKYIGGHEIYEISYK